MAVIKIVKGDAKVCVCLRIFQTRDPQSDLHRCRMSESLAPHILSPYHQAISRSLLMDSIPFTLPR